MSLRSWLQDLSSALAPRRDQRQHQRRGPVRATRHRPNLEVLEDRTVPSTFTVLNLLDSGPDSLREAIAAANGSPGADLIRFADGLKGTIPLGSELSITDDLTISGPGEDQLIIGGDDATRIFSISASTTDVEISRLTIADGSATGTTMIGPFGPVTMGGGILNHGGHLSLFHVTLTNNQVVGFNAAGAAIANVFGGTLTVEHCTFSGNESLGTREAAGGGIANDAGSSLTVTHSTFNSNQAIVADASAGAGGRAFGGGAIANRSGSQATVLYSTFADNLVRGGNGANGGPTQNGGAGGNGAGGAIANLADSLLVAAAGSTLTVEHTAFTGNQAIGGNGGGVGNGGIGGNGNGGAIVIVGAESSAVVSHSTFTGNQAKGGNGGDGGDGKRGGTGGVGQGGAIVQFSSTLTLEHSRIADNRATGGAGGNGGAGANGGAGGPGAGGAINSGVLNTTPNAQPTLTVDRLMIHGNRATGGRGGDGGSSGNGGAGGLGTGGGIRARGAMDVAHSLLVRNEATGGDGGDRGDGGTGGTGGLGSGGGIATDIGATGAVSHTLFVRNQVTGGAGGTGGSGGNGQGGAIWNGTPNPVTGIPSTLTFRGSIIVNNRADGGAAGVDGADGQGVGGGLYLTPGSIASADLLTLIFANQASTSNEDVFGILEIC